MHQKKMRQKYILIFFKYQRGDDEHQLVWKEFGEWVKDIPYVLCALAPLACPWRFFGFISDSLKVFSFLYNTCIFFNFVS